MSIVHIKECFMGFYITIYISLLYSSSADIFQIYCCSLYLCRGNISCSLKKITPQMCFVPSIHQVKFSWFIVNVWTIFPWYACMLEQAGVSECEHYMCLHVCLSVCLAISRVGLWNAISRVTDPYSWNGMLILMAVFSNSLGIVWLRAKVHFHHWGCNRLFVYLPRNAYIFFGSISDMLNKSVACTPTAGHYMT